MDRMSVHLKCIGPIPFLELSPALLICIESNVFFGICPLIFYVKICAYFITHSFTATPEFGDPVLV